MTEIRVAESAGFCFGVERAVDAVVSLLEMCIRDRYIPLGGNRRGLPIQIRNILVVWLLTGVWHGASWNFVAWGVYFGILLLAEKLFLLRLLTEAPRVIGHMYTMFFVMISWAIFAFDSLGAGWSFIRSLFGRCV